MNSLSFALDCWKWGCKHEPLWSTTHIASLYSEMVIRLSSMNWPFWPRLRIALTYGYKHLEDILTMCHFSKNSSSSNLMASDLPGMGFWEHGINLFLWSRSQIQLESSWLSPEQSCHSGWYYCTQCLPLGKTLLTVCFQDITCIVSSRSMKVIQQRGHSSLFPARFLYVPQPKCCVLSNGVFSSSSHGHRLIILDPKWNEMKWNLELCVPQL